MSDTPLNRGDPTGQLGVGQQRGVERLVTEQAREPIPQHSRSGRPRRSADADADADALAGQDQGAAPLVART